MSTKIKTDKIFLTILIVLSFIGLLVFISASLGILTESVVNFQKIVVKQIVLGLMLGWLLLFVAIKINYKKWDSLSVYIFFISIIISALVFIPGIGFGSGGAKRWIDIGFTTFQPSEIMKFGFVIFYASFLVKSKEKIKTLASGVVPTLMVLLVPSIILLKQPDMGTLFSLAIACLFMFAVAGGKKGHILLFITIGILLVIFMAYCKPYAMARLTTFLDPSKDPLGAGYQIRQSLIAIGSGQIIGRGFGQSIQKFNFLPEATGDSIFAVISEEFGFIGSVLVVILFLIFGLRGLTIASQINDQFGQLVVVGFVSIVVSQSFVNIGSMLSILPLSGVPLIFLSHGGTSLLITLFEMGIILNISQGIKIRSIK